MKLILIITVLAIAFTTYAQEADYTNLCTVSLFTKRITGYGDVVPDKPLGTAVSENHLGAAGTLGKLFNISKKRAVIYRGVISMDGVFKIQIEESDTYKGQPSFRNTKELSASKYYYSPYEENNADNKPAMIIMKDYIATVSCLSY